MGSCNDSNPLNSTPNTREIKYSSCAPHGSQPFNHLIVSFYMVLKSILGPLSFICNIDIVLGCDHNQTETIEFRANHEGFNSGCSEMK